jgi:hypothetical protein
MRLPSASPVWQHAATLEPQACWMGMATVEEIVSCDGIVWWMVEGAYELGRSSS